MILKPIHSEIAVEPCQTLDLRALYPLMRQTAPRLALPEWMQFARRQLARKDGKAGILVARRPGRGLPCGAVCWKLAHDLRLGWLLEAEYFITLDLLYPEAVLSALSAALDAMAAQRCCSAVRAIMHPHDAAIMASLGWAGQSNTPVTLIRDIASAKP